LRSQQYTTRRELKVGYLPGRRFLWDNKDGDNPDKPVFLVTIADIPLAHGSAAADKFNRNSTQTRSWLIGSSYIGMIEPGYYNVIYDEIGDRRKKLSVGMGIFECGVLTTKG
jgi:hypothetical protein